MSVHTDTDRYALALATIGDIAARYGIRAEELQDTDRGDAARLDDLKDQALAVLREVIKTDLSQTKPLWDAGKREYEARIRAGRIMRDCYTSARAGGAS